MTENMNPTYIHPLRKGDLIGISAAPNNHGCADYAVAIYLGSGKAAIVEAQNCQSCWQVGHDDAHTFYNVGDEVAVANVVEAGRGWGRSVKWEI